jgi:hypothetical protein
LLKANQQAAADGRYIVLFGQHPSLEPRRGRAVAQKRQKHMSRNKAGATSADETISH